MNSKPLIKTLVCAAVSASLLSACGESTSSNAGPDFGAPSAPPVSNTEFNEAALVANLTDAIITPTFSRFVARSATQMQRIGEYCAAEQSLAAGSGSAEATDAALEAAQQSWRDAMAIWQQAEVMQIGPLAADNALLRNQIYSWPTVSTCGVDFDVTFFEDGSVNGVPYDIALRTPARKGFDALEYLLFNTNIDHSCMTATVPEGWNARPEQERRIARCHYAQEVASDLNQNAQNLLNAWQGTDGFANVLKSAGTPGATLVNEHDAVNRISDALFYIDIATKDAKLATPLGLFANVCGAEVCPEAVESPYANHSFANIRANLEALRLLFTGDQGTGFDDFLQDVGDSDTATAMGNDINEAISAIDAFQQPLAQALASDEEGVTQAHGAVRDITDNLKADFINSLALELPATSAGDND